MKTILAAFILCFSMQQNISAQTLNEFQWKNRVLVIFTPEIDNDLFEQQVSLLRLAQEEMVERNLITIFVEPEGDYENTGLFLRKSQAEWYYNHFSVDPFAFEVFLVGLDGTTKVHYINKTITPQKLFTIIDQMPMRRNELIRKRRSGRK